MSWLSVPNWVLIYGLGVWTSGYWKDRGRFSYKYNKRVVDITRTSLIVSCSLYSLHYLYQSQVLSSYYPVTLRFSKGKDNRVNLRGDIKRLSQHVSNMGGNMKLSLQDDTRKLFQHVFNTEVRLQKDSEKLLEYVFDIYQALTSQSLEIRLFNKHWEFNPRTDTSALYRNRDLQFDNWDKFKGKRYIDRGIRRSKSKFRKDIDDINNRVEKLSDKFRKSIEKEVKKSLFCLTKERNGSIMLNYTGSLDSNNSSRALWHLAYIRDMCQVLEKWNPDRHDLRSLSDGLGSMMFEIKPLQEWKKEDWALLNKDTQRYIGNWDTLSWFNKFWIIGAYDSISALGTNVFKYLTSSSCSFNVKFLSYSFNVTASSYSFSDIFDDIFDQTQIVGNSNMLVNVVDPITGEFTDQGDDSLSL